MSEKATWWENRTYACSPVVLFRESCNAVYRAMSAELLLCRLRLRLYCKHRVMLDTSYEQSMKNADYVVVGPHGWTQSEQLFINLFCLIT
jgi:hypothetical protein